MNQTQNTCGECKSFDVTKGCTLPKWQVYEKNGSMSNGSNEVKKANDIAPLDCFEPRDDTD
jgi:hypothetical protein